MSDHFDAFNTEENYAALCTILGDAVFNIHREGGSVSQETIVRRLSQERRDRNDKLEDKYYEAVIRVLSAK
ncbi:DUF2767 family protein [[Erwinia] mediterraneensis]|uniref:DUF2767 family protein n=1 Tax=[Erwinia] mediterraneensis TaxID=2161819 RepID=UPI001031A197|nr:DUF2767 family protein [[Erwinia] mediterraneensis]